MAVLVGLGIPTGPVIASIHEHRDVMRNGLLAAARGAGVTSLHSIRAKRLRFGQDQFDAGRLKPAWSKSAWSTSLGGSPHRVADVADDGGHKRFVVAFRHHADHRLGT